MVTRPPSRPVLLVHVHDDGDVFDCSLDSRFLDDVNVYGCVEHRRVARRGRARGGWLWGSRPQGHPPTSQVQFP